MPQCLCSSMQSLRAQPWYSLRVRCHGSTGYSHRQNTGTHRPHIGLMISICVFFSNFFVHVCVPIRSLNASCPGSALQDDPSLKPVLTSRSTLPGPQPGPLKLLVCAALQGSTKQMSCSCVEAGRTHLTPGERLLGRHGLLFPGMTCNCSCN